ncbi:FAD/NAD(P)-binding domain-containing protein [Daedaleopsis nitida]|nr:FAD/NAD(P)-binding domain-containing protein [Daedaleopsis nitida]
MSLPHTADVLIVGGGPAGITLSLMLQKQGCSNVVILDGAPRGENTSRACAVHAATIEALEQIGVADRLVAEGLRLNRTTLWMNGLNPMDIAHFANLDKKTKYNFIVGIPQHVTETILYDAAVERGILVHRPYKVVDMKPNAADSSLTDVVFEDGHVLCTRCVVGADGARSTVRTIAGVGWDSPYMVDPNSPDTVSHMVVADVTLSAEPLHKDSINLVVTDGNALLLIWLPNHPYPEKTTEPVYRFACGVPSELGSPPKSAEKEYLQKLFDKYGPNVVKPEGAPAIQIKEAIWTSRFIARSSIAETFFTHVPNPNGAPGGPVFLVGDAGHIHPPMGGQGMNLGIRDAIRLAPVLTEYVRAVSSGAAGKNREQLEAPLKELGQERREKALKVIGMVKNLQTALWLPNKTKHWLGFVPYNPAHLRNSVLRVMTSFDWFKSLSAYRVSGLGNP